MIGDLDDMWRVSLTEYAEERHRRKQEEDLKIIQAMKYPVLQEAVHKAYCFLRTLAAKLNGRPLSAKARGLSNACLAGAVAFDTFSGRKMEHEVLDYEYACSMLWPEIQGHIICPKHKTSSTYGSLCKVVTPGLGMAMRTYASMHRPEGYKYFYVPPIFGTASVSFPGALRTFFTHFVPRDHVRVTFNQVRKSFHRELRKISDSEERMEKLMEVTDAHSARVQRSHYILKAPEDDKALGKFLIDAVLKETVAWPDHETAVDVIGRNRDLYKQCCRAAGEEVSDHEGDEDEAADDGHESEQEDDDESAPGSKEKDDELEFFAGAGKFNVQELAPLKVPPLQVRLGGLLDLTPAQMALLDETKRAMGDALPIGDRASSEAAPGSPSMQMWTRKAASPLEDEPPDEAAGSALKTPRGREKQGRSSASENPTRESKHGRPSTPELAAAPPSSGAVAASSAAVIAPVTYITQGKPHEKRANQEDKHKKIKKEKKEKQKGAHEEDSPKPPVTDMPQGTPHDNKTNHVEKREKSKKVKTEKQKGAREEDTPKKRARQEVAPDEAATAEPAPQKKKNAPEGGAPQDLADLQPPSRKQRRYKATVVDECSGVWNHPLTMDHVMDGSAVSQRDARLLDIHTTRSRVQKFSISERRFSVALLRAVQAEPDEIPPKAVLEEMIKRGNTSQYKLFPTLDIAQLELFEQLRHFFRMYMKIQAENPA